MSLDQLQRLLAAIDDAESFRQRCAEVNDWRQLFESAFDHGVAAVLAHRLAELGSAIPEAVDRRLAVDRLWHRRLATALDRALEALSKLGVRAVVLKGVPLGERLHPESHLRHTLDLDLLVEPADAEAARRALFEIRYRDGAVDPEEAAEVRAGAFFCHHHNELWDPSGIRLDLHHRASSGISLELAAEELMARAVP